MKIAITADLHLRSKEKTPERYHAFENILSQCVDINIPILIIAGDLFDKDESSFFAFEEICNNPAYKSVEIKIIPGNHDSKLSRSSLVTKTVEVFEEPALVSIDDKWEFAYIPYQKDKKMGEAIETVFPLTPGKKWAIIGHGDYFDTIGKVNSYDTYEKGIYMPFTRKDMEEFKPTRVFLGHIHIPGDLSGSVIYPGSPCGLDISETGYRQFIVFDTENETVEAKRVESDILYFKEKLIAFPIATSKSIIKDQIEEIKKHWSITPGDEGKVSIALKVAGYSHDKEALDKLILKEFRGFKMEREIDYSKLLVSNDPERDVLFEECLNLFEHNEEEINYNGLEDEVKLGILREVYGD